MALSIQDYTIIKVWPTTRVILDMVYLGTSVHMHVGYVSKLAIV